MTNVPPEIREIWTDLYKLFDIHYRMQNTEQDWKEFWKHAQEIYRKHGKNERLFEMLVLVADIISDRMKAEMNC